MAFCGVVRMTKRLPPNPVASKYAPVRAAGLTAGDILMTHILTFLTKVPSVNDHVEVTSCPPVEQGPRTDERLEGLLAAHDCPSTYSTAEVARFFGKTDQWVYWLLREGVRRADGSLIEPERVGKGRRRRFARPVIEEIAVALHLRGTLDRDGLRRVVANLDAAERPAA